MAVTETQDVADRRDAIAVLNRASSDQIERALGALADGLRVTELRAPETGLVMLRGRIGGDGAPFNVGEATVTRAAVQLSSGEKGYGYCLGRDRKKARLTALCDALWQSHGYRDALRRQVVEPLRAWQDERRQTTRERTAATRVDFFTLVRGED